MVVAGFKIEAEQADIGRSKNIRHLHRALECFKMGGKVVFDVDLAVAGADGADAHAAVIKLAFHLPGLRCSKGVDVQRLAEVAQLHVGDAVCSARGDLAGKGRFAAFVAERGKDKVCHNGTSEIIDYKESIALFPALCKAFGSEIPFFTKKE